MNMIHSCKRSCVWLSSVALVVVIALSSASSALAVVTDGDSASYGLFANVTLGQAPLFSILDHPSTTGTAPAPYNNNANVPNSNFDSMFNGFTVAQSVTGEIDVNAGSTVDGFAGIRSASADATVNNLSLQNQTQVLPAIPVTLAAVLDVNATQIQSTADVTGEFGGLAAVGTANLAGTAGAANDQASITVLGVEFLLETAPAPNTMFMITPFEVPNLEGFITVIQNEQFLVGDGTTNQSIHVNALHILINSGMVLLPPNFEPGAWTGEIIVGHSEAMLQAEPGGMPAPVPEPASIAIWSLIGLILVGMGCYRIR